MNVIVVGCGRVGSQLAVLLSRSGHTVSIVDKDPATFKELGKDFSGRTVKGLGFDEDTLKEAGIDDCEVLCAVTNLDNTNLMTAEVARSLYGVQHVITRLYNPERAQAYAQLSLDYVCGTTLISEDIYAKIQSGHGNHVDTFDEYEIMIFVLKLPAHQQYMTMKDFEDIGEIKICAVTHEGETNMCIRDTLLHDGDKVLAVVNQAHVKALNPYIKMN